MAAPAPAPAAAPHRRLLLAPAALLVAAVLGGAAVALLILALAGRTNFPAYNTSNVLRALTTVAQVAVLAFIGAAAWLAHRGESGRGLGPLGATAAVRTAKLALPLGNAALVAVSLALPLSATRLYLEGVSIDQEFRTQFLGRAATDAGLPDMAYQGMPSFYPSGWFWFGGRFAALLGVPGWEAFKPWSILSLAVVAAIVMVLWVRLLRTGLGAAVAVATTLLTVAFGAPEPYGAVVALLAPPMALLAWHAINPTRPGGGRVATAATTVYLGISACCYTLYTAWFALTVVLMAAATAWRNHAARRTGARTGADADARTAGPAAPILRLALIGGGSVLIALAAWAPYLWATLTGEVASSGTAVHYLPYESSVFPLPMFEASLVGALCLAGLVWIGLRVRTSRRAAALAWAVGTAYLWCALSMAAAALGTTLLAFRMELPLVLLLVTGAVFGAAELAAALETRLDTRLDAHLTARRAADAPATADSSPTAPGRRRATAPLVCLSTAVIAIGLTQQIPTQLQERLVIAYTDTDGHGARADRQDPGAAAVYPQIDALIQEATGKPRADTVVASGLPAFLALYPYWAFQAITSHYANPLGEYEARMAAIRSWGAATDPQQLRETLAAMPWGAPDVILAEVVDEGYAVRVAQDVYPNDPNVDFQDVVIPAAAVDGPPFTVTTIGEFAVIVVK